MNETIFLYEPRHAARRHAGHRRPCPPSWSPSFDPARQVPVLPLATAPSTPIMGRAGPEPRLPGDGPALPGAAAGRRALAVPARRGRRGRRWRTSKEDDGEGRARRTTRRTTTPSAAPTVIDLDGIAGRVVAAEDVRAPATTSASRPSRTASCCCARTSPSSSSTRTWTTAPAGELDLVKLRPRGAGDRAT